MKNNPAPQSSSVSNTASHMPKPRSFVARGVSWLLISGVVFATAWIATYLRYSSQRSLLTENVLLLNLFVLPVILTGVIAFGRYLYRSYLAQLAAEEQARQQVIATTKATEAAKQDRATDRRFDHISILAASVYTPLGNNAADIMAILEKQGPLAALSLDSNLLDTDGNTLITARIEALDKADAEDLSRTARIAGILRNTLDDLLVGVDFETLQEAIGQYKVATASDVKPEIEVFYQQHDTTQQPPELQVHLILPEALPAQSITSLSNQLREQIKASALGPLLLHLSLHHDTGAVYPLVNSAISTMLESTGKIILLAGADSLIDEAIIDTLLAQNKIRTVSEPSGRLSAEKLIPGEGGAALLLASSNLTQHNVQPLATLHRPAIAAANEAGCDLISCAHLLGSIESNQPLPEITQAFCDSPHSRSNQAVAQALSIALHHIDPIAQRVSVNQAFGYMGVAGGISSLALAAQHTDQSESGAICIGAQDGLNAAVTLLPSNTVHS